MGEDISAFERCCFIDDEEKLLLRSPERPIVLLRTRDQTFIAAGVAPEQKCLGWMLPYTPLHSLLLREASIPLVMTSGNISEEPITYNDEEAMRRLGAVADYFLANNRKIHTRCDDSVVRHVADRQITLRRSRGYAPTPIRLRQRFAQHTLACGAHLKNTFCLGKDDHAFLSPHIGDLENYETFDSFGESIERFKFLFDVRASVIAYDLHPDYLSSQYAASLDGAVKIGVQHHHAHIVSCMAEHGLDGLVIGVAFDGLGYGTDGTLWGGEFLIADLAEYSRRGHLRAVSLAGGDSVMRQPWRSALGYIKDSLGTNPHAFKLAGWQPVNVKTMALVERMLDQHVNTFRTSSCGRLFDAVASIVGLCQECTFEGQAAMALEAIACEAVMDEYPFEITGEACEVDMRPAITAIVRDALVGTEATVIAAKFHNTLVSVIVKMCLRLRRSEALNRVCLSGGTFQNIYLLGRAVARLKDHGFEVFVNSKTPLNDGGISLGQAVVANAVMLRRATPCV
jgi:hydrogenase maturation protein HypF